MYYETATPTTIYASKLFSFPASDWSRLRFPLEVEVPGGQLFVAELKQVSEGVIGFPDESRQATLRIGRLRTPLQVVVEVTRWSERSMELGLRPPRHLPFWVSSDRYVRTAYAVLAELARGIESLAAATALPTSA